MRARRKLLISIICLSLLAAPVLLLFYSKPSMPSYKGRSLAEWAQQLEGNPSDQEKQEAKTAIRAICPARISILVAWLDYDPRPRNARLFRRLRWLPRSLRSTLAEGPLEDRKELRAETALIVLAAIGPELGSEAAPAIPQLVKLVNSTNDFISDRATAVASYLSTNGLAILLPIVTDENHPRRYQALAAIDVMFYLGTNASSALPALVKCTQSKDPKIVRVAAQALGLFKMEPATSVPTLVAVLSNPDPKARAWAIRALGRFGQLAQPAVPSLIEALQDPVPEPRDEATNALLQIAPQALTNAPSH